MGTRRHVVWLAWDAIFSWPFIGRLVADYGAISVDLERPKPSTIRRARAVIAAGGALGLFPEGGRTSGALGELDPFKPGAARLALALGAPILPVSIRGARACWPKQHRLPRPGRIVVTYHEIVKPETIVPVTGRRDLEAKLMDRVLRAIASAL
jgi:1-acyl-sn-glycerol-3-phosphate acyltransferase